MTEDSAYPAHRVADVVLRDGSTVCIRPVHPEDAPSVTAFFRGLSPESAALRFRRGGVDFEAVAARECVVDYRRRFGLVATAGAAAAVVGQAYYEVGATGEAEAAFAVADRFQGRGLGTLLLAHLADAANAAGVHTFQAIVEPHNHRMVEVFRESGFPVEIAVAPGELRVTFPTLLTLAGQQRFEQRERLAAASALRHFFEPRAIAVVGASRERATVGGQIFRNLLEGPFAGPVYPVNPAASAVQGVLAYPTLLSTPDPVDLAVVAVPATAVLAVAGQCAAKGVGAIVVISAGFGEAGAAGQARQDELTRVCREAGIRMIGPNCLGIVNTDPAVHLNGLFSPIDPTPGAIAFASQSGALGLAAMDYAAALGIGLSSFVSMGNKADISSNDLLCYWEGDPRTRAILLYLESFGNPRKFGRIAQRVGKQKPIVCVKSGRSAAGARAASSHTGALLAASDVTVDALFRQAGVIRTDTLEELFDVAKLAAAQPVPPGPRVGIVTNAGGPGILCADTCEAEGLSVPPLTHPTQDAMRQLLPPNASVVNPVDMIATASADQFEQCVSAVLADPDIDAVIAIFIPPLVTTTADVAAALVRARAAGPPEKPLLAVFMTAAGPPAALAAGPAAIPSYGFPEPAARALAHAVRYTQWRARPSDPVAPPQGLRRDAAQALVAAALSHGPGWLGPDAVAELLACYGVAIARQGYAASPEAAAAFAAGLGGPAALKAVAPGLLHKSDVGGVALDLETPTAVLDAAAGMAQRLRAAGHEVQGYVVQEMVTGGVEMLVGLVHDHQFGPVVACGAGGVLVELLGDLSVGLTPLNHRDATDMVARLRSAPILAGYRGAPPRDAGALADLLVRVGIMAEDLPPIAEMDLNPVMVTESGVTVVDARVRIEVPEPPRPPGARRR